MTVSAHDSDDGPGSQDAPGSKGPGARRRGGQDGSYIVGVDFGTLSGRAVVVRVSDGAEVGTRGLHVPARGHGRQAGRDRRAAAAGLGPAGPGGLPGRAARGGPGGGPGGRHRPGPGDRHRDRLHRLHRAASPARRHPAVPGARAGGPPARLPQAVEAPRGPAPGRPDQRPGPRARRAVDRPVRGQDLLGVAVRQGPPAAGGGPGDLPAGGPLDRGGRLDHLAAVRHRDPQHLHRRVQGHLPGRPLSLGGLPRRAEPRLRQLRRGQAGPPGVAARVPGGRR